MAYDRPTPAETLQPTLSEAPPDVYSECHRVLSDWQTLHKNWPSMVDRHPEHAARWWVDDMQEPYQDDTERPRMVGTAGNNTEQRWHAPYQDRVRRNLRTFLGLPEDKQRVVVAAREDGYWWRGESEDVLVNGSPVWVYSHLLREYERQSEIGKEGYRRESVQRMKATQVGVGLPYNPGNRIG